MRVHTDPDCPAKRATLGLAVLAAGQSTRLRGAHKLLLPYPDQPLILSSVQTALASDLGPVAVVLESETGPVAQALGGFPVLLIENPDAEDGVSTSIRKAAEWAFQTNNALVLLLGDEPDVDPAVLKAMVERWYVDQPAALRAQYRDRPGHPSLVTERFLRETSNLTGDRGLAHRFEITTEYDFLVDAEAPVDIDTEADYQAALARITH